MAGTNEVTIDVVVRERGGKRVLKDVGDEAKKTGTKFNETSKDVKSLSKQLFDMDIQLRKTAQEMERTGDTSLVKAINKQKREINALVKIRRDVLGIEFGKKDDGGGVARAAGSAVGAMSSRAGEGVTKSLMALRGPAIAGVGALGVLLAPVLGGVIASAVLGGTGAGGIIGGLVLASRDSRVQEAGSKLGAHAMAAFTRSAEPFVGPAVEAIGVLRGVVDDVSGDMRQAFAKIAPALVPLTQGIGSMADRLMPGLTKAMEGARPVLLVVSRELPKIGAAIGEFLSTIAEDPRGAVRAFQDLSRIIQGTIIVTGNLIAFLARVWGTLGPIIQAAQGDVAGMAVSTAVTEAALADAARMGQDAAGAFEDVGESAEDAGERVVALNRAVDGFVDRILGLRGSTRAYEAAVDNLTQTLRDNGKTLDERTEKGRANEQAIDDNIQAIKELRQANIDNGMAVEEANAIYDRQLEQLRKTLLNFGLNKDEVNALIDAIKAIPAIAEVEVRAPGLLESLRRARELAALLGSGSAAARARAGDTSGYGGGRASGGYMAPGMTYHVAESGTGVERVKMLQGGGAIVQNADQWSAGGGAMAVGGGGGSGGGGAQHVIWEVRSGGTEVDDLITMIIRRTVTVVGGGNVQKTYGRNDR